MNPNIETKLKELYYNPQTGLASVQQLYINANEDCKIVTLKQVKEWLARQEHQQVFSRKKKLFNAIIGGPEDYRISCFFCNIKNKMMAMMVL
jgi:hypothetical protein